ncbi:MAG TPA: lactate utilization protein [Thermomicrobiales bacterium]|nr:lactate utilization protein [Thermomicrobiales bacterium]
MDHRGDAVTEMGADEALFARFSTRLAAAGGIAHRASTVEEAAKVIAERLTDPAGVIWTSAQVVDAQPDLVAALDRRGCAVRVAGDPASVRDQPLGLALARMAIAETGSVLLHESAIPDRSVSLMTNVLVAVCPLEALRPSLDDAAPVLREISRAHGSYATLVTGPSRTADIERQLTVGVQGPGEMHVVFMPAHSASQATDV